MQPLRESSPHARNCVSLSKTENTAYTVKTNNLYPSNVRACDELSSYVRINLQQPFRKIFAGYVNVWQIYIYARTYNQMWACMAIQILLSNFPEKTRFTHQLYNFFAHKLITYVDWCSIFILNKLSVDLCRSKINNFTTINF